MVEKRVVATEYGDLTGENLAGAIMEANQGPNGNNDLTRKI